MTFRSIRPAGGWWKPALFAVTVAAALIITQAGMRSAAPTAWTQLSPTGTPPVARYRHTSVYDPSSNRLIVFGGQAPTSGCGLDPLNDTWVLTNANGVGGTPAWLQLAPSGTLPAARGGHGAGYDATNDRMIVFGGDSTGCFPPTFNDVWVLIGASGTPGTPSWTKLTTSGATPPGLVRPAVAYDSAHNKLIVFGGNTNEGNCFGEINDVWTLSNANGLGGGAVWTKLAPSGTLPAKRWYHSGVYDSGSDGFIMFGGGGTCGGGFNDTWILTGISGTPAWVQFAPSGTPPSSFRTGHSAVYDSGANLMTIFGGNAPSGFVNETWTLQAANGLGAPAWMQLAPSGTPPTGRFAPSVGYDAASGRMMIFGGLSSVMLNDAWLLTPADTTPPILTLPANITAQATSAAGAVVTYTATATDNVDGAVTPTCNPVSGATFAFGTTTVNCSATDAAANTANGSFSVTVVDTMPPSITLPAPITVDATSAAGAVVSFTATATDAVDGPRPVTCTPASGATFPVGTTSVTCSASDTRSNAVSGSFNVAVYRNAWIQLAPTGTAPAPRERHVAVYDPTSNKLLVYGGLPPGCGSPFNDVWALSNANGVGGTPTWTQVVPQGTPPTARSAARAVYDFANDRMVLFGGDGGSHCVSGAMFSDTWILSGALRGTPTWTPLSTVGSVPPGLATPAVAYDAARNKLIVFAGNTFEGSCGTEINAARVLLNANGVGGTPTWTTLAPTGTLPSARWHVPGVYDPGADSLTIFSGTGTCSPGPNDTRVLRNISTAPNWIQLLPATSPSARAGHSAVFDASFNRMTMFGGQGPGGFFNEAWALQSANGIGSPTWTQLSPGPPPPARANHSAAYDAATGRMIIFGGGGATFFNDVWVLLRTLTPADTTPPVLTLPANITAQATSAAGAVVTYTATATDNVDGAVTPTCNPVSGATFAFGTTTVNCSATDAAANTANGSFSVTVQDTTPPSLALPPPISVSTTDPAGSTVTLTVTATDLVDGPRPVTCTPPSGSTFPVGTTSVTCASSDTRANTVSGSFNVVVTFSGPPPVIWTGATGDGLWTTAGNWDANRVPTASDTVIINVNQVVTAAGTPISFATLTLGNSSGSPAPTLVMATTMASGGELTVDKNATFRSQTLSQLAMSKLTVKNGGKLTHAANGSTNTPLYKLNLNVSGAFDLQAGAVIDVTGLGFGGATGPLQNGYGPGGGRASTDAGGGGYGGMGGDCRTNPAACAGGSTYGSANNPVDLGSGGAGGYNNGNFGAPVCATAGGGTVIITAQTATLAGSVSANGRDKSQSCAGANGSGGTINIRAQSLTGAGAMSAKGGSSGTDNNQGGGGGGRLVVGGTVTHTFAGSCSVAGGTVAGGGNPGQAGTAMCSLLLADTTPPVLTLPANITAEATSAAGAVVTYTATATDDVDGAVTATCAPVSGSTFAIGTTTVNCSATDAAANTANGSFSVTVQDTTPPALTLPANITKEATGAGGAMVSFTATALDLVDGARVVTCTPTSGATFALGTTPVTCSATDTHNNTASGGFAVTVQDTTPPVLTLPANIIAEATGPSGTVIVFSASASDLVSGARPVICVPSTGSPFGIGSTTVSCSAADAAGNVKSGTFTVTVVDTTPPVLTFVTPTIDSFISSSPTTVAVQAVDAVGVGSLKVNGIAATLVGTPQNGTWQAAVPVTLPVAPGGALTFTAAATDFSSNTGSAVLAVDDDGVAALIDKNAATGADQSAVYSNDFTDGSTFGSIVSRGGWTVSVNDLIPPTGEALGVRASVAGSGTLARLTVCGGTYKEVRLDRANETATLTCSGSTLRVTADVASPTIDLIKRYRTFLRTRSLFFSLTTGQSALFGSPITADPSNTQPIVVSILDENDVPFGSFVLDPGESIDVDFADGPAGETFVKLRVLNGTVSVTIGGQTFTLTADQGLQTFVFGAKAIIQGVLDEVTALRSGLTNKQDGDKLDEAIKRLKKALDPALWLSLIRLQPKGGEKVFGEVKDAVGKLRDLSKEKKSSIADATLQGLIDRLANAVRQLASIAIDDAIAAHGRQNKIDQAIDERAKGDKDLANQKFESAFEHYRNAWTHAVEAIQAESEREGDAARWFDWTGEELSGRGPSQNP